MNSCRSENRRTRRSAASMESCCSPTRTHIRLTSNPRQEADIVRITVDLPNAAQHVLLSIVIGNFPRPRGLARDSPEIFLNLMVFQVGESERAPKVAEVDACGVMRAEEYKIWPFEKDHFRADVVIGPKSRICISARRDHRHDVVFVDNSRQRQETQPLHAFSGGEARLPERYYARNLHPILDQINRQNGRNRASERVSRDVGLVSRLQHRLQDAVNGYGGGIEARMNGKVNPTILSQR